MNKYDNFVSNRCSFSVHGTFVGVLKAIWFWLDVNKRGSLINNDVITNETDMMHIILYCYGLQVA